MKFIYHFIFLMIVCSGSFAQGLVIASGTPWHAANNTPVKLTISGDIDIESSAVDFSKATLELTGTTQTLTAPNLVNFQSLIANGTGDANFTLAGNGVWQVNQSLTLGNGVINASATSHLLYTGSARSEGSSLSYVNGPFHIKGSSFYFPIGNPGVAIKYSPAFINVQSGANGDIDMAMSVVASGPGFGITGDITSITNESYYVLSGDPARIGNDVTVGLTTPGDLSTTSGSYVVLQGQAPGDPSPVSLGGQQYEAGFITSFKRPSNSILAVGISSNIDIVIYDLITPYTKDGVNDRLRISNIDHFKDNKVMLLDRWGQVAKEWTKFKNADDPTFDSVTDDFDFTKLNPDSYICILEYTDAGVTKKLAQMVTVLKSK